jgi:hypothetical protein
MGEAWFTGFADELARCLVDARDCADACEHLLESAQLGAQQKQGLDLLVAPIAIAQVLMDLIDHPKERALSGVRLLADSAEHAAATLSTLGTASDESAAAVDALRRVAASSRRLLEATS